MKSFINISNIIINTNEIETLEIDLKAEDATEKSNILIHLKDTDSYTIEYETVENIMEDWTRLINILC